MAGDDVVSAVYNGNPGVLTYAIRTCRSPLMVNYTVLYFENVQWQTLRRLSYPSAPVMVIRPMSPRVHR
jgi:hypothetical protein